MYTVGDVVDDINSTWQPQGRQPAERVYSLLRSTCPNARIGLWGTIVQDCRTSADLMRAWTNHTVVVTEVQEGLAKGVVLRDGMLFAVQKSI